MVSTIRARLGCQRDSFMSVGAVAVLLFIAVALGYMAGRADRIALRPFRWSGRLPPFDDRDPGASVSGRSRGSPPTRLRPRSRFAPRQGDRAAGTSDRDPAPGERPRESD